MNALHPIANTADLDVGTALGNLAQSYAEQRPGSRQLHNIRQDMLPDGVTRSVLGTSPFPFTIASANGSRLTDVDGFSYVDYLGDYSVAIAGHRIPAVVSAVEKVLADGWCFGAVSSLESEVAAQLCSRFPSFERIRFTATGTEANMLAIMLAKQVTGRQSIVVFDGAYHGGWLSFDKHRQSMTAPFDHVICDYNDINQVRAVFASEPESIACVVVEPMLGSGGRIKGDPEFLGALRDLTAEHGAVLIFDEVQTSRMSHGGAQKLLSIKPDLTSIGKYFGGGLPFGAVGGSEKILELLKKSSPMAVDHSGTFNNNRFTMAAASAMLSEVLTEADLVSLYERGERLRADLNSYLRSAGWQATGWGSLMGVHPTESAITRADDLKSVDRRLNRLLYHQMLERGFYIGPSGLVTLSFTQTAEDDASFLEAMRESVEAISRGLG